MSEQAPKAPTSLLQMIIWLTITIPKEGRVVHLYLNPPFIDISVDTHVRRVFGRTGLVESSDLGPEHNHRVVYKARELHPKYPAVLDTAAWSIGINYCHAKDPNCKGCPLKSLCTHSRTRDIANN